MKRELGEIWKDDKNWMIQLPKGRLAFKTKKKAMEWQQLIMKDFKITLYNK